MARRFTAYRNYSLADPRFYEEFGNAKLPYDLEGELRELAGPDDEVVVNGVWAIMRPSGVAPLPAHGWKIHVSAVPDQARLALEVVGREFRRQPFHFKVLRDRQMVMAATSRAWPTGQVGKIITLYPLDAAEARGLLERLHPALLEAGVRGPYILTDRRYLDSSCLYYRYGEFISAGRVAPDGSRESVLIGPDGQEWADDRKPVYRKPPWVDELFEAHSEKPAGGERVINGYKVIRALQHGGAGGVYLAERVGDGARAVLKEARPHTAFAFDGSDRQARLRREFDALTRVKDSGVAPQPYDLFEAWEHLFLAEEYIEALPLVSFLASRSPLALGDPDPATARKHEEELSLVLAGIRKAVEVCHESGVAYGDLSLTNVFVDPDTLRVWLIDFESSQGLDTWRADLPATPGFMPRRGSAALADGRAFDEFGLSSLELAMVFPRNLLRELDDAALARSTIHAASLLRKPLGDLLERAGLPAAPPSRGLDSLDVTVKESVRFIEAVMTPERADRVFPADPLVFTTNPWSVAHGVAGVVRALHRLTGSIPEPLSDWIDRARHLERVPAGLSFGLAGVGWTLLEAGKPVLGREFIDRALRRDATQALPADVSTGSAGVGMAALAAWLRTGEESYVDQAVYLADRLIASAQDSGVGLYWPVMGSNARHPNGWALGSSGIAAFFLYTYRVSGERRFLNAGRRALNFELAQLTDRDDGGIWLPGHVDSTIFEPYWETGGAGFGGALARYAAATGDERLRTTLDRLVRSIVIGTAVNPGLYVGMAGLVNFALDCAHLTGEASYRELGATMAEGILALACEQPEGIAFPGHGLLRFSTDFATGNAGIALALDRLRTGGPDFHYTLDSLLEARDA